MGLIGQQITVHIYVREHYFWLVVLGFAKLFWLHKLEFQTPKPLCILVVNSYPVGFLPHLFYGSLVCRYFSLIFSIIMAGSARCYSADAVQCLN